MSDSEGVKTVRRLDAIRVARKRLPILPDRKLNENLGMFCGDLAEAYRVGAEEAQQEIIARLRNLAPNGGA